MRNVLTVDVEDWPQSTLNNSLPLTQRVVDNTLKLLDILRKREVKATFFILGLVVEKFPELINVVLRE